jgi:hypothetical protein
MKTVPAGCYFRIAQPAIQAADFCERFSFAASSRIVRPPITQAASVAPGSLAMLAESMSHRAGADWQGRGALVIQE